MHSIRWDSNRKSYTLTHIILIHAKQLALFQCGKNFSPTLWLEQFQHSFNRFSTPCRETEKLMNEIQIQCFWLNLMPFWQLKTHEMSILIDDLIHLHEFLLVNIRKKPPNKSTLKSFSSVDIFVFPYFCLSRLGNCSFEHLDASIVSMSHCLREGVCVYATCTALPPPPPFQIDIKIAYSPRWNSRNGTVIRNHRCVLVSNSTISLTQKNA